MFENQSSIDILGEGGTHNLEIDKFSYLLTKISMDIETHIQMWHSSILSTTWYD